MTQETAYEVNSIIDRITELKITLQIIDTWKFGFETDTFLRPEKTDLVNKLRVFARKSIEDRIKELENKIAEL